MADALIVTHSNFGIGHFARAKNIANALVKKGMQPLIAFSGIEVSEDFWGSGVLAQSFSEPDHWKTIEDGKLGRDIYSEPSTDARVRSLRSITNKNRFRILIYELVPFYKHRFIAEFLALVREQKAKGVRVGVSLREIIDEKVSPPVQYSSAFFEAIGLIDFVIIHGHPDPNSEEFIRILNQKRVPYFFCGPLVKAAERSMRDSSLAVATVGAGKDGCEVVQ